MDRPELAVIITDGPEWLINRPAYFHPITQTIQPDCIAPNGWYTCDKIKWRLVNSTDTYHRCPYCGVITHLLCKNCRCRDCARKKA